MKKKIWKNLEIKTAVILLVVVALISVSLYAVFYGQYHGLVISKLQDDAIVVHRYAEEVIDEATFFELNTIEDEQTELYQTAHLQLDEVRRIANIMYLYTAKMNENGQFIYVIDGLNEDDIGEDGYFCHIGDPIEPEIVSLLERCLNDEVILGNEILNTEWGIVYVAYFPFHDSYGNVIGAIGMEFDCTNLYNASNRVRLISVVFAVVISVAFVALAYFVERRLVKNAEAAFTDAQKEKAEAEEMMRSIMNASPLACQYWSRDLKIIDCNKAALKLYGYKNKQEYIERWERECNPEYQPDGQRSSERAPALVEKAFAEGKCVFDWTHQMIDGTVVPSEVTLVRVLSGDISFVAGYTRDLRKEKALEERVGDVYFDKLTGVYTKQYEEDRVKRLIRVLSRSAGELTVMMVGIDFMTAYYDEYGGKAGNECLKTVAEILRESARRADDFVARYRDDEFVIVLPNTDSVGAKMIADKLLADVREQKIPHKKSTVAGHVTLSIGITTGRVNHRQRGTDYINRADEMLYISRQGGRDRCSYADL